MVKDDRVLTVVAATATGSRSRSLVFHFLRSGITCGILELMHDNYEVHPSSAHRFRLTVRFVVRESLKVKNFEYLV